MTKSEFRKKTKELKKEVNRLIDDRIEKVLKDKNILLNLGFEEFENNYILPKLFISAMGKEIEFQFSPFDETHQKQLNLLKNYL